MKLYNYVLEEVLKAGYKEEIEWCRNIPKTIDKTYFFREYCWVVINSGMLNKVAEKIFKRFWNGGQYNFEAIGHPNKNRSIREVYNSLDRYYYQFENTKNILKFLESLPHIGKITKYHLARNLGVDIAKPDRHLVRISEFFGYKDVQKFCKAIAEQVHEKIGVVDLVFWRFAELHSNYLELFEKYTLDVFK